MMQQGIAGRCLLVASISQDCHVPAQTTTLDAEILKHVGASCCSFGELGAHAIDHEVWTVPTAADEVRQGPKRQCSDSELAAKLLELDRLIEQRRFAIAEAERGNRRT